MILNIKTFFNINWKLVFKDVAKFYIYLLFFLCIGEVLVRLYIYHFLQSCTLDFNSFLSSDKIEGCNFDENFYKFTGTLGGFFIILLACFAVFFSIPPKKFNHLAIVTAFIFLIFIIPLLSNPNLKMIYDFFMLCGFILIPWTLSHAWNEFRKNRIPLKNLC
jgi:hypothetical protein